MPESSHGVPELSFSFGEATALENAAVPTITAPLHVTNATEQQPVQSLLLNCQMQIEPLGRTYSGAEEARLLDMFGGRGRWGRTMKPMLWTNQVLKIGSFEAEITTNLLLPCSLDFDVATTKYFYGLEAGTIHVTTLFSGTIFYTSAGSLRVAQIPWDREARLELPVDVWRKAVDAHYPDGVWLRLPNVTFDRLYTFKNARGIASWDGVIDRLVNRIEHLDTKEPLGTAEGATL